MSHYYTERIKELDRLNLELYRACRAAHALLDSKSRNAAEIERVLREAMRKAELAKEREDVISE